jgi:hypothetical protein
MYLTSLMQLKNSYFAYGTNSTKVGMIDYLFEHRPRYLLVDEIDKMGPKDHALLLNLMETVALHPNTIQSKIEGKALLVRKKSKLMGVNNMKGCIKR